MLLTHLNGDKTASTEYEAADLPLHELQLSGKGDRIVGLHYHDSRHESSPSVVYVWDFNTGKILLKNEIKGCQQFSNIAGNMLTIDCSNINDFSSGFGHENPEHPTTLDVKLTIWDLDTCKRAVDLTEQFAWVDGSIKLKYTFQNAGVGKYALEAWWGLNHKMTLIKKTYTLK